MSGPLLYDFSECSSPSPLATPIARRGLSYHKVREASRSTTGTVERKASNAVSQRSETSIASKPQSLQVRSNNENTQISRRASYLRPSQKPESISLRSVSLDTQGESADSRLIDITSSVNRAAPTNWAHHIIKNDSCSPQFTDTQHSSKIGEVSGKSSDNSDHPRSIKAKGDHSFKSFMKTLGFSSSTKEAKPNPKDEVLSNSANATVRPSASESSNRNALSTSGDAIVQGASLVSTSHPVSLRTKGSSIKHAPSRKRRNSLLRRSTDTARLTRGGQRQSFEGNRDAMQGIDEAAQNRAIQRTRKLQELIQSEGSYVADLKILLNVYLVLLGSTIQTPTRVLTHFQQNVSDILQLHQDLLAQLTQNASPSEKGDDTSNVKTFVAPYATKKSVKSHRPGDCHVSFQALDTQKIRDVARIFDCLVCTRPFQKLAS